MPNYKKEEREEIVTQKYKDGYDIFEDKDILIALENEIKPYGDFFKLCDAKGWIRLWQRKNESTYDFTVNPETSSYFTDYCARYRTLQKRQDFFLKKQLEADKQRLPL